jgi:hypothetical protein
MFVLQDQLNLIHDIKPTYESEENIGYWKFEYRYGY